MRSPIAYALQFRGETVSLGEGRIRSETRAPSCVLVTVVGRDGLDGRFEEIGSGEAICTREVVLGADGSVTGEGEVSFGAAGAITFLVRGEIAESPDPRLRHGTAVCTVTGGRGPLARAHGFVTSNFLLSETGDLTDHHLGLLFVERSD
jgi:hypothetical protein